MPVFRNSFPVNHRQGAVVIDEALLHMEAQRAKSKPDFISKTEGALQELDETGYWLEPIRESGVDGSSTMSNLQAEANELLAIFVALTRTAKLNKVRS